MKRVRVGLYVLVGSIQLILFSFVFDGRGIHITDIFSSYSHTLA